MVKDDLRALLDCLSNARLLHSFYNITTGYPNHHLKYQKYLEQNFTIANDRRKHLTQTHNSWQSATTQHFRNI